MEFAEALAKAKELLAQKQVKAALKILQSLYKTHQDNAQVLYLLLSCFEQLNQVQNARKAIYKLTKMEPDNGCSLWLRASHLDGSDIGKATALKDVEKGLALSPTSVNLLARKVELLYQTGKAEQADLLIEKFIGYSPQMCVLKAARSQILVEQAKADTQDSKPEYSPETIEQAFQDIEEVIEHCEPDWRHLAQRAHIFSIQQRYQEAVNDFYRAIEMLDGQQPSIVEELQRRLTECRRHLPEPPIEDVDPQIAQVLTSAKQEQEQEPLTDSAAAEDFVESDDSGEERNEQSVSDVIETPVEEPTQELAEELETDIPFLDDDPNHQVAYKLAQEILENACEPAPEFKRADSATFSRAQQKYNASVKEELLLIGYKHLGDYEALHLSNRVGRPILAALFVANNKRSAAMAYRMEPASGNLVTSVLSKFSKKKDRINVVQFESQLSDGFFVITNNADETIKPEYSHQLHIHSMPRKTKVAKVYESHQSQTSSSELDLRHISSKEDVLALQSEIIQAKNNSVRRVGFVNEKELRALVGTQFDTLAPLVKSFLRQS